MLQKCLWWTKKKNKKKTEKMQIQIDIHISDSRPFGAGFKMLWIVKKYTTPLCPLC